MKWRRAVISGKQMHNWGLASPSCSWQLLLLVMEEDQNRGTGTGEEDVPTTSGIHSHLSYRIQWFGLWYPFLLLETWWKGAEDKKKSVSKWHACPTVWPGAKLCHAQRWDSTPVPVACYLQHTPFPPGICLGCNLVSEEKIELDPACRRNSYRDVDRSRCIFSLTQQVCSAWISC